MGQRVLGTRSFLFRSDSDRWLSILRIGLGTELILYCLSLWKDWDYLLASTGRGLISRDLAEAVLGAESIVIPRLSWLVALGEKIGFQSETVVQAAWVLLLLAGILLCFGFYSRTAAVAAWFMHLCAVKSGDLVVYGVDNFVTIGLFYLMLSPLPDRLSLDWRLRKPKEKDPELLGFWRRILQLHLCLIYFFSGLTKALGAGWWNGSNLWRALIRPPFNVVSSEILVNGKHFFPVLGVAVWVIEIGYPFFVWNKQTRAAWLMSVIFLHLGIGLFMGMYLFALVMIVLNLAAFGPGTLWREKQTADVDRSAPAETA